METILSLSDVACRSTTAIIAHRACHGVERSNAHEHGEERDANERRRSITRPRQPLGRWAASGVSANRATGCHAVLEFSS